MLFGGGEIKNNKGGDKDSSQENGSNNIHILYGVYSWSMYAGHVVDAILTQATTKQIT